MRRPPNQNPWFLSGGRRIGAPTEDAVFADAMNGVPTTAPKSLPLQGKVDCAKRKTKEVVPRTP